MHDRAIRDETKANKTIPARRLLLREVVQVSQIELKYKSPHYRAFISKHILKVESCKSSMCRHQRTSCSRLNGRRD